VWSPEVEDRVDDAPGGLAGDGRAGDQRAVGRRHEEVDQRVGVDVGADLVGADVHMGGATPPPEPGAERVIVRIVPRQVYVPPGYDPGSDAAGTADT
jgi:hypothetical protein